MKQIKPIVSVELQSDAVRRWNEATKIIKEAEEVQAVLRPEITQPAVAAYIQAKVENPALESKAVDVNDATGARVEVRLAERYPKWLKAEAIEALAPILGKTANKFFQYVPLVEINQKAFTNGGGKFNGKKFAELMSKVNELAKSMGVENPFIISQVLVPTPEFSEQRWRLFGVPENLRIQEVVPMQVSIYQPKQ
jgi:hypothetical protein